MIDRTQPAGGLSWSVRLWFYHLYAGCCALSTVVLVVPARGIGVLPGQQVMVTWMALNAVAVLLLLGRLQHASHGLGVVLLLSTYLLCSTLWSVLPSASLDYALILVGVVVVGWMVANDLTAVEILQLVARVVVVLTVLGLLLYAAGADLAIYRDPANRPNVFGGAPFKGVFPHKIVAGVYMSLGMLAVLASGWRRGATALSVLILLCAVLL